MLLILCDKAATSWFLAIFLIGGYIIEPLRAPSTEKDEEFLFCYGDWLESGVNPRIMYLLPYFNLLRCNAPRSAVIDYQG